MKTKTLKAISYKLLPVAVIVLFTAVIVATPDILAQSSSPCTCQDVPDLLNLLNTDHAILDGLQEYGDKIVKPTDLVNEIALSSNPNKLTKGQLLRQVIKQQMDWVKDKNAHNASGEIDSVSCEWKVQADTPCLKSILETREILEKAFCKVYKEENKLGEKDDELNFMSLNDYLDRQKELYSREIPRILKLLSEMDPACRLKDWFGTITVYENIIQNTVIQKETAEDTTIRGGTIRFTGDSSIPFSSWQVSGKYVNTKSGQGVSDCTGGLDTPKPDTPYKTSFKIEVNKSGSAYVPSLVDVGEPDEDNKVSISFLIPEVIARGDGQTIDFRESGCPNDSFNKVLPYTAANYTLSSERVEFKAAFIKGNSRIKGDPPQKISGAGTIPFASISAPGMTLSHTVQVTIHLYKLDK